MQKTLVTLVKSATSGFILILLLFCPNAVFGQSIQLSETIKLDSKTEFQVSPASFCIIEDKLFLFPDLENGTIKIFENEGNVLKCVRAFGSGNELFIEPRYCFYSQDGSKVGVLDYGIRKGFIFKRNVAVGFEPIKIFDCKKFGYDIKFASDGIHTIVSGYITDSNGNPFDLYSINSETGQIGYLLPSPEKHGLSPGVYIDEYYRKQTLPAIGIKGFFDVQGDDLFYVWEGDLQVIKLNLCNKSITQVFGQKTLHYTKPDGSRLSEPYIKGDFPTTWKLQETFSYIRNIFVTNDHVFVVYETGKKIESDISTFRLQIYTLDGEFLKDLMMPNNPGRQMSFDKTSNELYALTKSTGAGKGELAILRYKISR